MKTRISQISMRLMYLFTMSILLIGLLMHPANQLVADSKVPMNHADFKALVGENFSVYGGMGLRKVITLKLIEVSPPRENGKLVDFSARFQGPADYSLDKNIYTFEQAQTGAFPLFLEPAGVDTNGRYYQALFSLLK